MKSWMMELWKRNHDESEWPDSSIRQTKNACHVTDAEKHPSMESIETMCSEDFFVKHNYRYVDPLTVDVGEEEYYASCSSCGSLEVNGIGESSSGYHEPYNGRSLRRGQARLVPKKVPNFPYPRKNEDGKLDKKDVTESHSGNGSTGFHRRSVKENELRKAINDESSDEMEETYDDVAVAVTSKQDSKKSHDAKVNSYDGRTILHTCSVATIEKSTCSRPGEKQEEDDIESSKTMYDTSGYLRPVEMESGERNGTKRLSSNANTTSNLHYSSVDVSGFKRSNDIEENPINNTKIPNSRIVRRKEALSACSSNPDEMQQDYNEPPICEEEYEELPVNDAFALYIEMKRNEDDGTELQSCNAITTDILFYSSVNVAGCKSLHDTEDDPCNVSTTANTCSVRRNEALSASNNEASGFSHPDEVEQEDCEDYVVMPVYDASSHSGVRTKHQNRNKVTNDTIFNTPTGVAVCKKSHDNKQEPYNEITILQGCRRNEALSGSTNGATGYLNPDKIEEGYEQPLNPMYGASDVLLPVEKKGDKGQHQTCDEITTDTIYYSSAEVAGCKRRHNKICQVEHSSATYSELNPEKKFVVGYQTLAFNSNRDDSSMHEDKTRLKECRNDTHAYNEHKLDKKGKFVCDDVTECITWSRASLKQFSMKKTLLGEYQNTSYQVHEDENCTANDNDEDDNSSQYHDMTGFITEDRTRLEQCSKSKKSLDEYQNIACSRDKDDNDFAYGDNFGFITRDGTRLEQFSRINNMREYQNMASTLDEEDDSLAYDDVIGFPKKDGTCLEQFSKSKTCLGENLDEGHCLKNEESLHNIEDHRNLGEYQNMAEHGFGSLDENNTTRRFKPQCNPEVYSFQNIEYLETLPFSTSVNRERKSATRFQTKKKKKSPATDKETVYKNTTSGLHPIPRGKHLNANLQMKADTRHSKKKAVYKQQETLPQAVQVSRISANNDSGTQRHHSSVSVAQLNDPSLSVIYC